MPLAGVEAVHTRQDQTTTFILTTVEPLDFVNEQYETWVEGAGSRLVSIREVLHEERFYDPQAVLGATWGPEATTFRVFAPTAQGVQVVLADERTGEAGLNLHEMTRGERGVWAAAIDGNLQGKYYAYRLRGIGFNPKSEVADIYAACMQGRYPRSLIVNMAATDPPGFREQSYQLPQNLADAFVYEVHVRDFTISSDSGVSPPNRGKYLGLTEAGTRLPEHPAIATGLDHLAELGVTHVQLMPVQDFDNAEEKDDGYHWGYMPVQFNSPEGWYASSVTGPARVSELKAAIAALHARNIGVILDVVYNHTAKAAPFDRLVPGYYYRKTPADHFCNGSGCGNEFASEAPMARKFILDSLKMWVREYRVDGFRFDLLGLMDGDTVRQFRDELHAMRPELVLVGEPWVAGPTPLKQVTDKMQLRGSGIASFNDVFRDAVKGDRDNGPPGFVQCGDRAEQVRQGLAGCIHAWCIDPTDTINYVECHDNLTLWDKLVQSMPDASEEEMERADRLAALMLFAAQGTVFIQSGQEFRRSKRGHSNSYDLPDVVNRVEWTAKKRHAGLCEYYRGLAAIRRAHPAFRLRKRADVEYRVWFGDVPTERTIAHIIHSAELPGETAQAIVMLYNGNGHAVDFALGPGTWSIHADSDRAGLEPLGRAEGKVSVPGHGGMMLMRLE